MSNCTHVSSCNQDFAFGLTESASAKVGITVLILFAAK